MNGKPTNLEQYNDIIRNIKGTFAAEDMSIDKDTRTYLDQILSGQATYQQVLRELTDEYKNLVDKHKNGEQ